MLSDRQKLVVGIVNSTFANSICPSVLGQSEWAHKRFKLCFTPCTQEKYTLLSDISALICACRKASHSWPTIRHSRHSLSADAARRQPALHLSECLPAN